MNMIETVLVDKFISFKNASILYYTDNTVIGKGPTKKAKVFVRAIYKDFVVLLSFTPHQLKKYIIPDENCNPSKSHVTVENNRVQYSFYMFKPITVSIPQSVFDSRIIEYNHNIVEVLYCIYKDIYCTNNNIVYWTYVFENTNSSAIQSTNELIGSVHKPVFWYPIIADLNNTDWIFSGIIKEKYTSNIKPHILLHSHFPKLYNKIHKTKLMRLLELVIK